MNALRLEFYTAFATLPWKRQSVRVPSAHPDDVAIIFFYLNEAKSTVYCCIKLIQNTIYMSNKHDYKKENEKEGKEKVKGWAILNVICQRLDKAG